MKKLNPEYIKRINHLANRSPYFELLSMNIKDMGLGFAVLEIDLSEKHLQPFGLVHGGVFASIIDAAAFWALFCEIEDQNTGATTVDLKLFPWTSGYTRGCSGLTCQNTLSPIIPPLCTADTLRKFLQGFSFSCRLRH